MTRPDLSLARELEAALAFWQAAGVSHDFHDDATAWLAEAPLAPAPEAGGKRGGAERRPAGTAPAAAQAAMVRERGAAPAAAPATSRPDLLGDSPPGDLATFRDWWMHAPGIAPAQTFPRVPPRGEQGASLLVLVPQPEEGDRTRLLEGPQGRLLANILAAIGLEENAVYIAAALPSHTPMADLPALAAGGMDKVTAHHIALAAPERVLVLGTALAPMLGGAGADSLREINHGPCKVPLMASETLEAMLHSPTLKGRFWRRWIEWSASS